MKATELIEQLQSLIDEHGDLEMTVFDHDECCTYLLDGCVYEDKGYHGEEQTPSLQISHVGYQSDIWE